MSSGDKEPGDAFKRILKLSVQTVILTVSEDERIPLNGNKHRSFQTNRTPESSRHLVMRDEPQLLWFSNSPTSHGSGTLHPVTRHLPLRMQNKATRSDKRPTGNVSSGSIRNEFQREAPRKHPADDFKPLQTAKPLTNNMTTGRTSAFTLAFSTNTV